MHMANVHPKLQNLFTLLFFSQNLFAVGLDQVVTCFSLPSEPRAFALVYKKDGADGYCCANLMLNDALTSLSVCMMD